MLKIRIIAFYFVLLLLSANFSFAQLLRPQYSEKCPELLTSIAEITFSHVIGDVKPLPEKVFFPANEDLTILRPNASSLPEWLHINEITSDYIEISVSKRELPQYIEYSLPIIALVTSNCQDTFLLIKIEYQVSDYNKFKWLSRIELGGTAPIIYQSSRSIFNRGVISKYKENYDSSLSYGLAFGLDIIEIYAPKSLSGFSLSLGTTFKWSKLAGTKLDALTKEIDISEVSSKMEFYLNVNAKYPLENLYSSWKDLNLCGYLTLPYTSFSYVNSSGGDKLNDKLDLVLSYSMGIRWDAYSWMSFEARVNHSFYESFNGNYENDDGTYVNGYKIPFAVIQPEILISIPNVYERVSSYFKD